MSEIKFDLSDENPVVSNVASFSALASELELNIPDYQRPYVWKIKQTRMLLKDIENSENGALLGSIILHKTENKADDGKTIYEVIDGQQRLTTIKLILMALENKIIKLGDKKINLDNENKTSSLFYKTASLFFMQLHKYQIYLKDVSFFHKISQDNIKTNYEYIKNYLSNEDKAKDFLEKLENTQFIIVATTKADDAFIFFDNTNSKGKKLESYDLIKAFHLQAMQERHKDLQNANAKYFERVILSNEIDINEFMDIILVYSRCFIKMGVYPNNDFDIFAEFCKENLNGFASFDNGVIRDFAQGIEFFEYFKKYYEMVKFIQNTDVYFKLNGIYKYYKHGLCVIMLIFMDRFRSGNFDLIIRLIARIILNHRICDDNPSYQKVLGLACEISRVIYFSSYESEVVDYLNDLIVVKTANEYAEAKYTWVAYKLLDNTRDFYNKEFKKHEIAIISDEVFNKFSNKVQK